jgi:hypothetical protein
VDEETAIRRLESSLADGDRELQRRRQEARQRSVPADAGQADEHGGRPGAVRGGERWGAGPETARPPEWLMKLMRHKPELVRRDR